MTGRVGIPTDYQAQSSMRKPVVGRACLGRKVLPLGCLGLPCGGLASKFHVVFDRHGLTPRLGIPAVAGYGWGILSLTPGGLRWSVRLLPSEPG